MLSSEWLLQKDLNLLCAIRTNYRTSPNRLEIVSRACGIENKSNTNKIAINSSRKITPRPNNILASGQKLEEEHNFAYVGCTLNKFDTPTKMVQISYMLHQQCYEKNDISCYKRIKLQRTLMISIQLNGCEGRILRDATGSGWLHLLITFTGSRCAIRNNEHNADDYASRKEPLSAIVKCRKLSWYGSLTRHNYSCPRPYSIDR